MPLPLRRPLSVVEPVPPLATPSVPSSVSVPVVVIGPPENVRPVVPPEASIDVTPVFEMMPVAGSYAIPVPAESDVELILLLKAMKSKLER